MNKKICDELLKDLEEIRRMNKEMKEPEVMIYAIKNLPVIKTNGKIFNYDEISKEDKEKLLQKLTEVFDLLIDYSKLEIEITKEKDPKIAKNRKFKNIEKVVIEGDFEECMEQIENADIPEEVKKLARSEIRKHFK